MCRVAIQRARISRGNLEFDLPRPSAFELRHQFLREGLSFRGRVLAVDGGARAATRPRTGDAIRACVGARKRRPLLSLRSWRACARPGVRTDPALRDARALLASRGFAAFAPERA